MESVDIVHTLGFGSGCIDLELLGIPHVFGDPQCLKGRECSSSPTSGTVFSLFRGLWAADCAQIVLRGPLRGLFISGRCCDRLPPCLPGSIDGWSVVTCSWTSLAWAT
jgi:hypothetical protein